MRMVDGKLTKIENPTQYYGNNPDEIKLEKA